MEDLKRRLRQEYGWQLRGQWNRRQLDVLLESAAAIEQFVADLQRQPSGGWVRRYLNPIFRKSRVIGRVIPALRGKSFVFPWRDVWMEEGFERSSGAQQHVVHELGHVLDNRLGGWLPATFAGRGPADEMVRYVGGAPEKAALRFRPMTGYVAMISPFEHWQAGAYGNMAVAEDFAETFTNCIFSPEQVPPRRRQWMRSFLRRLD